MAIFPVSPTLGQEETVLGRTFVYDGHGWVAKDKGKHVFEDSTDTALPTRSVAKAGEGIEFEDDAVNEKTVVKVSDEVFSHVDGADEEKHTVNQIYGGSTDDNKIYYADPTTKKLTPSNFTVDQIVQVGDIDVSDIGVGERKIMLVEKDENEEPVFSGAVGLLDIIANPGLDVLLAETNPLWDDNQITLTGNNLQGQLGENSQFFYLDGDFFLCVAHNNGTTSNGTATWRRNKGDDTLDPDNIANHAAIIAELETESGWNAVAMFKVTAAQSKRGMWWRSASGGYLYMCIDKNNGWTRVGTPPTVPIEITSASHPNLTTSLNSHDFSTGLYQENGTDEEAEQGQEWWDETNDAVYKRNMNGKWAKIFG